MNGAPAVSGVILTVGGASLVVVPGETDRASFAAVDEIVVEKITAASAR